MDSTPKPTESQYDQEEKKECRKKLIEHAVISLTTERTTSACVHRDHVRKTWEELRGRSSFNEQEIAEIEEDIANWERLHDKELQTRTPSDLRVCFLAGDNPLNDFNVFLENGVLPQNMWAIEKDNNTFKKALENMNQSSNRPKIFKGNFCDFLRDVEGQFDIIYFDACGSLPSVNQETLKAIGYVFLYNKLTSPGALITTFSFPPPEETEEAAASDASQDQERKNLTDLTREYLKYRLVNTSTAHKIPHFNKGFLNARSDEDNYSEYIVHQIIDTAYMYVPAQRIISSKRNSLLEQSFVKKGDIKKAIEELLPQLELDKEGSTSKILLEELEKIEFLIKDTEKDLLELKEESLMAEQDFIDLTVLLEILVQTDERGLEKVKHRLVKEVELLRLKLDQCKMQKDSLTPQLQENKEEKDRVKLELSDHEAQPQRILGQLGQSLQESTNPLCKTWCSEVFPDWKTDDLKKWKISLLLMVHLLTNWIIFIDKCSNGSFKDCLGTIVRSLGGDGDNSKLAQLLLDVPNEAATTQMLATLLYGQMASPSFPVLEKLQMLHYTAKKRQMFSNVFIFDRCRYVYEQFPSVHTASSVARPHRQMVFRMAVDGLRKHLRHICEEDVFKSCNVVEEGMQERIPVIPESTEITTESQQD